jgi:hypothetical protein
MEYATIKKGEINKTPRIRWIVLYLMKMSVSRDGVLWPFRAWDDVFPGGIK